MSDSDAPDPRQSRYVYLVPHRPSALHDSNQPDDQIDLRALWQTVWLGRRTIAAVTLCSMISAGLYAFTAAEWYRSDVVLSPVSKKSMAGGLGQLGGLASLAGIDIPSAGSGEPLAVLKSKSFAREFIEEQKLLPVLLADEWDTTNRDWKEHGDARPDIRDGVKYFDEYVRTVTEDKKSGLVTLSIKWKSGAVAADWANLLVKRLNDRLRTEAIHEAQSSIEYLQQEMLASSIISLQQSIGRVLEGEMQKMALARANEEFAFKVIDPATPSKHRVSPRRSLLVGLSTLVGLTLSVLFVLGRSAMLKQGSRA